MSCSDTPVTAAKINEMQMVTTDDSITTNGYSNIFCLICDLSNNNIGITSMENNVKFVVHLSPYIL